MKIKIAHLYPYELNLYGENGNIKALKYALEKNNVETEIININKDDKIDLHDIDFLYIGSGRASFLELVKKRLEPYRNELLSYISSDKIFLATGNAVSVLDFLKLYEVTEYQEHKVADVQATSSLIEETIKGFQNTEYLIKSTSSILFNIEKGYGNNDTLMEGYQKNNFYATSIIGPILARNEHLTNYFVDILLKQKTS